MANERDDQQSNQNQDRDSQGHNSTGQMHGSQQQGSQQDRQQQSDWSAGESFSSPTEGKDRGHSATGQSAQDGATLTSSTTGQESGQESGQKLGQGIGQETGQKSDQTGAGGFVGSQRSDSSDYLQEKNQSDSDIEGSSTRTPPSGE